MPAGGEIYFEIYKASNAGLGWRWVMWQQVSPDARAIITSCYGRTLESQEAARAQLDAFKKLVAMSPTRLA